jgi:glycerol-3-phosphate O-acyltransferase/dihydroxyacetone phosphate acyltransferase
VLATWKVLICLGVAPVLYTFYACVATFIAIRAKAPLKWRIWTPFLVFVALPFMNYAALKFGEAGVDVLKYVFQLSNEVADLINDFGPTLYEDFNEVRSWLITKLIC